MQIKRWSKRIKDIFLDFMSGVGFYWLFVEIFSYSTENKTDVLFKSIYVFFIAVFVVFIVSCIKNRPKKSFKYNLRNKDNYIEIKVGDAFENNGTIIVPVNNEFDMSLGGNVLKSNSIQSQVIKKYYLGNIDHINTDISKHIKIGNKYDVGKTIEIDHAKKKLYLIVNSIKMKNNRVKSELDDFVDALNGLWRHVALDSGRNVNITIPLINTQHGRDSYLTREGAVKEIINSYIENSKHLNICENLIISIHPTDLIKGNINLDEIDEYLKYQCKHYRKITLSQRDEDPDNGSNIISIES